MKYIIKTFGGESIILTDEQYTGIVAGWDAGADEFEIGRQRVPRKAVSFIGLTEGAGDQEIMERNAYYMSLSAEDQKKLKEARYKSACMMTEINQNRAIESGKTHELKHLGKIIEQAK